jgi:SAM-dependent methyltransferase
MGLSPLTGRAATAEAMPLLKRYPDVIEEVSDRDHMVNRKRPENYALLGKAGLDAVRLTLLAAQKEAPRSILDLPSGHGRVLRFLKAEYPDAVLAACDIDHEAVDFCAQVFGAEPVYGQEHPGDIELPRQFHLIWCGSLLTHLDAPMWSEFFDFFEGALKPRGLLIFTTHGRRIRSKLEDPKAGEVYLSGAETRQRVLDSYDTTGFGFADYPATPEAQDRSQPSSYGLTLTQPSWVWGFLEQRPSLLAVTFMEDRWGGQDVIGVLNARARSSLRIPFGS